MFLHHLPSKRIGYVSVLILLFFVACNKKEIIPSDIHQIPVDARGDLQTILFLNDSVGYIAGGSRYHFTEILQTNDGGRTWTVNAFTDYTFKAIYGLCEYDNRVYGAAFDGKVFWLPHPESSWQIRQTQLWDWFHGIDFAAANKGFMVAGIAFHNGIIAQIDSTGNVLAVDSLDMELADVHFTDKNTGYVCGYGAILKTTDGGTTWDFLNVQGDFFKAICSPDGHNIWSVGYNGSIVHSTDGGVTWTKQRNGNNPLLKRWRLNDVVFKDARTGYAVGDKGLIIRTVNGGTDWYPVKNEYEQDLYSITLQDEGTIWAVGAQGIILKITE